MSLKQFRVVDPILSQYARGYRQRELVASALFPIAFVQQYGGNRIQFGKESFRKVNTKRAPGGTVKRVQFGYSGAPYTIIPSDLAAQVPEERLRDASQVPGIDLARRSAGGTLKILQLSHEADAAAIATNPANYGANNKLTLVGAARWTDPDSDPITDIEDAKDQIAGQTGMDPNTLVLSRKASSALRRHPKVVAKLASNVTQIVSLEQLSVILDIPTVRVAGAVYAEGADDDLNPVWGTDAVLAYVAQGSGDVSDVDQDEPSYGQTYVIEGHPVIYEPRWDADTRSWVYDVAFHQTPLITGALAGFLFKDAGAPAA